MKNITLIALIAGVAVLAGASALTLPVGQGVKPNGKTFYADPDTIHHQVYTGYRVQYQAYKQAQLLASRQNPALNVHPDPHGVLVNEFDGWVPGPLDQIDRD